MIYKKIKKMLETALEDVGEKGEITSGNLELIEKLICSIKNINDIEQAERSSNENKSFDSRPSRTYNYGYDYGYGYDEPIMRGMSNRRGRDTMGRYTYDHEAEMNEIISEMHELKSRVSDPHTKHKIDTMIQELR